VNIQDLDQLILLLNHEAYEGELEHHGSATTRFELRSNGEQIIVWFMGHIIWRSYEDERETDTDYPEEYEPIETYLRRESAAFMERMMAKPSPDDGKPPL
jgi:hypothetical protein